MTKPEIRTSQDRTESRRPLLEEFQLLGDGVDWLVTRLSPQPVS